MTVSADFIYEMVREKNVNMMQEFHRLLKVCPIRLETFINKLKTYSLNDALYLVKQIIIIEEYKGAL